MQLFDRQTKRFVATARPKPAPFRTPTPARTIPEGDFSHSLGLPQRSAGYPRSPSPTHDSTRKELATESRRWTDATPAHGRKRCFLLEGEQEANGRMREATHPSTHRVPARMKRSGRARLRPSRSAGRAPFEHRANGPPVPSKRQAGSVAPPGTPPLRAVRQLHKPRSTRLPRRQLVGYR